MRLKDYLKLLDLNTTAHHVQSHSLLMHLHNILKVLINLIKVKIEMQLKLLKSC